MSLQIEQSGFSTADLQNATSRAEIETIVGAWQPVLNSVNLLYFFDYMFILSGVLLFLSLNALLLKNLLGKGKLHLIPKIGLVLTIFSRTFDALENLLTILIYTNPEKFNLILLSMLPKVSVVKWILVSMEYSLMCIGWVIVIILKIRNKKKN